MIDHKEIWLAEEDTNGERQWMYRDVFSTEAIHYIRADLVVAIPKWVTITLSPDTWPDPKRDVILESHDTLTLKMPFSRRCYNFELGKRWRYMIDIDYPPGTEPK